MPGADERFRHGAGILCGIPVHRLSADRRPGLHRDDDGGGGLRRGSGAALQAVCGPAVHRLAARLGIYPDHRLSAEPHHVRRLLRGPVRHGTGGCVAEICGGGQHGPGIRRGVGGIRAAAGPGVRGGGDGPGGVCPAVRRQRPVRLLCHRRLRRGVHADLPDHPERAGCGGHPAPAKLRGILHMKKIGHTGTLDPDAVGVLPVCLGKGTGLCSMITDWTKTYEAVMLLGTVTDTQDTSGTVLKTREVNVTKRQILEVCSSFEGEYDQIPPMYSALKVNGKKLYELARAGVEVERKPRRIKINSLRVNDINLEDDIKTVTITVDCSKGTYIRTLCQDIGEKLGCGACMMELIRTRVGDFLIDDTLTLNQIAAYMIKGEMEEHIISIDSMFPSYTRLTVDEAYNKLLYNGNKLPLEAVVNEDCEFLDMEKFRIYDSGNTFVGIYQYIAGQFVLEKMFYEG